MNLKNYLAKERGLMAQLCRDIGAHAPDVSRWANGERPVPVHFAPKIEKATQGLVTRKELFPDTWADLWPELQEAQ